MKDKSNENWIAGQKCLDDGNVNAAASRYYYGVLQAVLGWARAKKGYDRTQKGGVHSKMAEFVRSEGKGRDFYGRKFAELQSLRETADYQPEPADETDLRSLLPDCEKMREYYLKKAEPI
jgi:uncharacterized protein (UPF0332 family)